jgi:hypothetical protein
VGGAALAPVDGAGEFRPRVASVPGVEPGDLVFDAELLLLESMDRVVVRLRLGFELVDGTFKLGVFRPKGLDVTVQTHG